MGFSVSQHGQVGAIPPPPFLSVSLFWKACEVWGAIPPPPQKGYLSDTCAIPCENKGKWVRYPPLQYYLERVLREMGGYLATGPLRSENWPFRKSAYSVCPWHFPAKEGGMGDVHETLRTPWNLRLCPEIRLCAGSCSENSVGFRMFLQRSWDAIPRTGVFAIPRIEVFWAPRAAPREIPRISLPELREWPFHWARERFFLKLGWSKGFWKMWFTKQAFPMDEKKR